MSDLPKLRAAATKAETAFEAALIAHYGQDAVGYARFFSPCDMPRNVAWLATRHRVATDRLMQALRAPDRDRP
jgi:hypothetical protein